MTVSRPLSNSFQTVYIASQSCTTESQNRRQIEMAKTGHARNAEHFQQMISFCTGYGTDYDPTNAMIALTAPDWS